MRRRVPWPENIIQQRIGVKSLGFGADVQKRSEKNIGDLLREIQPEDLLKFGLIPEFVGRLPVLVTLDELDEQSLVQILTEPKNALVKQYQKLFEMEDVKLAFTEGALNSVSKEAIRRKSGARGLRAILETVMLPIMYDIPSHDNVKEVVVSEEVIRHKEAPIIVYEKKKESA